MSTKTETIIETISDEKYLENMKNAIDFLSNIDNRYKELCDAQSILDKKVSDILHNGIENARFDVFKGYNTAKDLQITLQQRRLVKNEFEMIQLLYEFKKDYKKIEFDMSKTSAVMHKLNKRHLNWTYSERIPEEAIIKVI
jgi:hypothetical protein